MQQMLWQYRTETLLIPLYLARLISRWATESVDDATNLLYSILPALAFSLDMFSKTHMSFGVNEVLLASVLGSFVFSIFAAQPLVIVGVTGMPLSIFLATNNQ